MFAVAHRLAGRPDHPRTAAQRAGKRVLTLPKWKVNVTFSASFQYGLIAHGGYLWCSCLTGKG